MDTLPSPALEPTLSLDQLLHRTTTRILQSLELSDILAVTAAEVRSYLQTDRVMIYQFHGDESGQVVAEDIYAQRLPSLLGLNFPADDIPKPIREQFANHQMRSVVDLASQQIGQSFAHHAQSREIIPEDLDYRQVDPCHVEYLTAMGVQSSIAFPILHQGRLWGLLVSHHSQPRTVTLTELQSVQMVVDQIAVAIAQSILLQQAREKTRIESAVNRIASLLRCEEEAHLQTALEELVQALGGVGGRLYIQPTAFTLQPTLTGHLVTLQESSRDIVRLYTCGLQPQLPKQSALGHIEQSVLWREHFQKIAHPVWEMDDLYQVPTLEPLLEFFQPTAIRGILMISLDYGQKNLGYLTIFRNAIAVETLWAGFHDPDQRQLRPRQSFEMWKESKTGQVNPWTSNDQDLAQASANHFSAAILHHQIHWQLQTSNSYLEQQVEERTRQLQQSVEQQQALLEVVTKIRASLNSQILFQTTTQEVCHLLEVERVAVYQFEPDWGGHFVHDFEATLPEWQGKIRLGENLVWNDTYLQVTQGGRYRNNETFAVDDVHQAGLYDCHVDILDQFQVRAFAIAPIFVGPQLWGLLAAYLHSRTQAWTDSQVKFLAQTAAQLGMALQQSQLLEQTQQQAQELAIALEELQRTQMQLIQSEKLSSLGQLVSGIAHEIDNPINFIYGNLSHARDYSEDLLQLLSSYQQAYPQPSLDIQQQVEAIDLDFLQEDLPKLLASMKLGADRIRQIITSLLTFSRLDQSEIKAVNLHEGIESTLLLLQHRLKAKANHLGIEVVKEYGQLPLVECYAGQLNQVFMDLFTHTINILEEINVDRSYSQMKQLPSRITLRTRQVGQQWVQISILNNSVAIAKSLQKTLKNPCSDLCEILPIHHKGHKISLLASQQIITEKHGGKLDCLLIPNHGTELILQIPISPRAINAT